MSDNKKLYKLSLTALRRLIMAVMAIMVLMMPAYGQEMLSGKKAASATTQIALNYKSWSTAGWSASVKSDMLPVSVTAKTFMQCDSLTLISFRAPLIGEVARIEIDRQAIYVINKMKKRYVRLSISEYGTLASTLHSNIQDILIGRATIIGKGTLSKSNYKDFDIYKVDDNIFLLSSQLSLGDNTVNYGYAVDMQGRILEMMAAQGKPHTSDSSSTQDDMLTISKSLTVGVNYDKKGADAQLSMQLGQASYSASLNNAQIEWGIKGFDRLNLKNYTQTNSIKELLRF